MTVAPPQARPADFDDQAPHDITVVLNQAVAGDVAARDKIYSLLYGELVRLARSHLAGSGAVRSTRRRSSTRLICACCGATPHRCATAERSSPTPRP